MPTGLSVQQLEEYGIEATTEQAQAITREVLSLNLFWIFAAIEAHIPLKYQSALSDHMLASIEALVQRANQPNGCCHCALNCPWCRIDVTSSSS